ncbi:MAG TPA: hypothetical protein VK498_06280 [Ferruginibacter sp.]|nr:hypothetical protein [Ferruginibacter sp.]
MESDSLTLNIIISAILFSAGYLISAAILPLHTTIKTLSTLSLNRSVFIWECFKYILLFLILGFIVTVISSFITLMLFNSITKNVDEIEEAGKGKIGYSVLMAVLVIVITLFVREPFINILESMIPYPDLPFMPK